MKKSLQGFTFIELMIVVAVIGILAAFAIPAYQNYVIRSQVAEGFSLSSPMRAAMSEYYLEIGAWPDVERLVGLYETPDIRGTYTKKVSIEDNVVQIIFAATAHPAIANGQIDMVATDNSGSVSWRCAGSREILSIHLPSICR